MALKSSWELALERTAKNAPPAVQLTTAQKARLAEIDRIYTAKIAEEEITFQPRLAAARAKGESEAVEKIEEQLRKQLEKLRRKWQEEKDAVRQGKPA